MHLLFFVLKTIELNKKKNKPTVIYDDIPKLVSEEEDKEIKKDKKKLVEKKITTKSKTKKKERIKESIEKKKEPIDEISSIVK